MSDEMDVAAWNAANPLHPRSGDGRFSIAGTVAQLIEDFGEIITREEFGERDHHLSDHGMIAVHNDATMTISAIDEDGKALTVAALNSDDAGVLHERLDTALENLEGLSPGQHSDVDDDDEDNPFPVSVTYGVLSDGSKYVALTDNLDPENGNGLQLSEDHGRDFMEQLEAVREQQWQHERDKDNPYLIRPLPEDENLARRTKVGSENYDDVLLGIVDTPRGRRLRLGLGGGDNLPERSFTGGPGPMVADLGPDEARELETAIATSLEDMKAYHARQEAFSAEGGPLDQWLETESGRLWRELNATYEIFTSSENPVHGGNRWVLSHLARGEHGGPDPTSPDSVHAPAEVYAEYDRLTAEQQALYAEHGLVDDEGSVFGSHDVETATGTVRIDMYAWDPETPPDVRLTVRPKGTDADEWYDDVASTYEAYAELTPAQLKKLRKLVVTAFQDAQGNPVSKSAGGAARRADNQRIAREGRKYWTRSAEGLGKWARSAHPWTKLYNHLVTKMNPETARRLTSSYFKAVFGYAPSARQGKNPVGRG